MPHRQGSVVEFTVFRRPELAAEIKELGEKFGSKVGRFVVDHLSRAFWPVAY
jgi:hypothetical protein